MLKCESCGKPFSESRKLKRHIQTVHGGHLDYKCEPCGKEFLQESILQRHIDTVHEKKKYPCDLCNKLLSRPDKVVAHKKSVHQFIQEM